MKFALDNKGCFNRLQRPMLQDQASPIQFETQIIPDIAQMQELGHSLPKKGRGGHNLNALQRTFAQYYVLTGNATESARLAGYEHPERCGLRNLCNPSVLHQIKTLAVVNTQAKLPEMLNELVLIGLNREIDAKARVSAITAFLDRAGLKPKADGPSVNVQVNINGRDAQQAIAEVWSARNQRKGEPKAPDISLLSDIPDTMSDNLDDDDDLIIQGELEAAQDTGGGSVLAGPVASSDALPPPIPPSSSSVSMVDD